MNRESAHGRQRSTESLACAEVEWDEGGGYTIDLVSPWEIEPDVMEESSRDGDMARDERREERRQEGRGAMRSALSGSWWQVDHSAERLRIASAGPFEGGWTRGEAEGSGGAPPAPFANAAKEHSGGAVGQDVLRAIHGREHFMDVLLSFHRAHGLTMRVPVFAHESMDLWKLFLEVTRLGGYTSVTESKVTTYPVGSALCLER